MKEKHNHTATLVDGRHYRLIVPNPSKPQDPSAIVFENGKPVPITAATMAHLKEHAIRPVTMRLANGRAETSHECQFEFAPIEAAISAETVA